MTVTIKKPHEIDILREGGQRLGTVVREIVSLVVPGITTGELDMRAQEMIANMGDTPAFLGYKPYGHKKAFPGAFCISVNEEIVHGIPGSRMINDGDIVTIDGGLIHQGLYTDHAITVIAGAARLPAHQNLLDDTRRALDIGIAAVRPGAHVGDIGAAIEQFVNKRYGIVRELAGHGVGYAVHEDPYVPNFGKPGTGIEIKPGMVFAIEPMLTIGKPGIVTLMDGYTIITRDKSLSAHFEHTVVVTENGCEVVTKI